VPAAGKHILRRPHAPKKSGRAMQTSAAFKLYRKLHLLCCAPSRRAAKRERSHTPRAARACKRHGHGVAARAEGERAPHHPGRIVCKSTRRQVSTN